MEIILKAYKLTVENIVDEPWHWDDIIVYADTAGEEKSKGIIKFDGAEVENEDKRYYSKHREVIFTDINARRLPELDKVEYEGEIISKAKVSQKEWQKKRDQEALELYQNNPNGIAVIYAGCYNQYWGANRSGYATAIEFAGKYSTKDAYEIVKGSSYDRRETVKLLNKDEYNDNIQSKINSIKSSAEKEIERLEKTLI